MSDTQDIRVIPVCEAADPDPCDVNFTLPPGACDTHAHIFDQDWPTPLIAERTYTPPPATLANYLMLLEQLGVERGVIVQPSVYGTDNRTTLKAVELAGSRLRAVVVVDDTASLQQLKTMHQQGARGVRANMLFSSNAALDNLERLAKTLAEINWHLQVLIDISKFEDLFGFFSKLPVQVVFDHMGHMPVKNGLQNQGFQDLLRLLERGNAWVKLSGAYRITSQRDTPYTDVTPIARALVEANPDNLLWGSDWPHPHFNIPMPNDGDLLNMLPNWVENPQTRKKILVDNPARLYGFSA